jgi:hypothetical protein
MKLSLLPLAVLVAAISAPCQQLILVGKPAISHVLTYSPAYLGGDTQLSQRIEVRDEHGRPLAGVAVRLYARSRNGVLMRLRSLGVTDPNGLVAVTGLFELENDPHVSLQACLVEREEVCSPPGDFNLVRRTDFELAFSYEKNTQIGDLGYSLNGKAQSGVFAEAQSAYDISARTVFSVFDHRSKSGKESAVSVYTGYSYGANINDSLLSPKLNTETLRPGGVITGGNLVFLSRLLVEGSAALPGKSEGGYRDAEAMYVQPLTKRFNGLAGYSLYVPLPPHGTVLGRSQGPRAGLQLLPGSGAQSLRFLAGWVTTNRSSFPDPSNPANTIELPAMRSPEATFAWDFHRGGPVFTNFTFSAGNIGTPLPPYYTMGITVTLRNFLRKLP